MPISSYIKMQTSKIFLSLLMLLVLLPFSLAVPTVDITTGSSSTSVDSSYPTVNIYYPDAPYVISGANYSINVNNTEFHRGLTPQQVANLAPAPILNSTQFETGEPVTIKMSWLTSFIEGISKWLDYFKRGENIQLQQMNLTNVSYIQLNKISGVCDLSVNGTICSNTTGTYIIG